MKPSSRLFAALGPGDIVAARKAAIAGLPTGGTSIAYSEQLFAYCRHQHLEILAISYNPRVDAVRHGVITAENRPRPIANAAGFLFYVSCICYMFYLGVRAWRFGASIAILDLGTAPPFTFFFFRLLGIQVVVDMHNALWPCGFPPRGRLAKIVRLMNAWFFRYGASGGVGVSPECERQFVGEARYPIPFFQYRCQFLHNGFKFSQPNESSPFRILFVGRAEQNKGLLDIAKISTFIRSHSSAQVIFEVCGDGPALSELESTVDRQNLSEIVIHGRVEREALLEIYAAAHAVIIPTRSDFTEGVPAVCAEAMLTGLPVITSQVTHAFDVIGGATITVETDNIEAYAKAILSLINNPGWYNALRSECHLLSLQFLDRSFSLPAAVDRAIASILFTKRLDAYELLFEPHQSL
jgi:glycogen synthase